jgi:FAD/FMN-containing dehydrogenase
LQPVCRVTPVNALDVSTILKIIVAENAPFAVKSGGHMQWAGAANIEGGVTVDLSVLNGVTVGTEGEMGEVVALGAGLVL